MKLKVLRFFENLFFDIGSWFEDQADCIDIELHESLRRSMNEYYYYTLHYNNSGDNPDKITYRVL